MAPPPVLMEELVEEVLLRLPPDDPATLVRAALCCKQWCRLVSGSRFRRRFREFHRAAAPVLGFYLDLWDEEGEAYVARFVPTSASCPPHVDFGGFALDARHGRVLLYTVRAPREEELPLVLEYDFVVCNPFTGAQKELPVLNWYQYSLTWKASVLCAAAADGTCDHLACHDESFLVVFLGIVMDHVFVIIYSSETETWSLATRCHLGPLVSCYSGPGSLLAEGVLHYAIEDGRRILSFDVSSCALSVSTTPWNHRVGNMGLVTAEDGELGVAGVEGYKLCLWSTCLDPDDGVSTWKLDRIIELDMMLSIDIGVPSTEFHVVGFAEGANTIFVSGSDGIYAVTLESGQVKKVHERTHFYGIVPYVSFCTPDVARSILPPSEHQ